MCTLGEHEFENFTKKFLDASSHLCKRVCLSVGPSVGPQCVFFNCKNEGFFPSCVIKKAQEDHRNEELYLYRKVGLLVRPSIHELGLKKRSKGCIY